MKTRAPTLTHAPKKKYYLNFFELGILKRVVLNPRIEVITTASMIPEEVAKIYVASFAMSKFRRAAVVGQNAVMADSAIQ